MAVPLIERIKAHVTSSTDIAHYPTASLSKIAEAESRLGFAIPDLLQQCYLQIGNGGLYKSGLGLIGLHGGFETAYGSLVVLYEAFRGGKEQMGDEWPFGLLPFWEWGCNIYSCVDCTDSNHRISICEEFVIYPQRYTLDAFFELWLEGVDILNCEGVEFEESEIINPFTREKTKITKRKRS